MEYGLLLIFWYGILHAFGPDHLTAIADFSIGKNKRRTLLITFLFALGHGATLFLFAKLLQMYDISDSLLGYGDVISSSVILMIGFYLLFMVATDRIQLHKHIHEGHEHIHIWFGKEHSHDERDTFGALSIGILMGIGGVRGMLVTLGAIEAGSVGLEMVLVFTLGVSVVFMSFGAIILYINSTLLSTKENLRRVFATAGIVSVVVGTNMILG